MDIKRTKANILKNIYYDINKPHAFSSVYNLYKSGKKRDKSLTLLQTKNWLAKQDTYTKHAPAHYNFLRRKILTKGLNDQYQGDLISLIPLAKYNNKQKYIFTLIDCFSRYLFALPIKTKTPNEIIRILKYVLKQRKFHYFQTDDGTEFIAKKVQEF
jgi:IS30 family transposase